MKVSMIFVYVWLAKAAIIRISTQCYSFGERHFCMLYITQSYTDLLRLEITLLQCYVNILKNGRGHGDVSYYTKIQ